MAIYAYVTEQCRRQLRRVNASLNDSIDELVSRIESTQDMRLLSCDFPPPIRVRKQFGGRKGRLLAYLREIGNDVVAVFQAYYIRGDNEYEDLVRDPVGFARAQGWPDSPSESELRAWMEERKRSGENAPAKRQLSPAESNFLYDTSRRTLPLAEEHIIYESEDWVEMVKGSVFRDRLIALYDACSKTPAQPLEKLTCVVDDSKRCGVWFYKKQGKTLLLSPFSLNDPGESVAAAKKIAEKLYQDYQKLQQTSDDGSADEAISRLARRAYPEFLLADENYWMAIQKDDQANFALSAEEIEVLEHALQEKNRYPLFINGRAGSGKSTTLYYLFVATLASFIPHSRDFEHPPLFLTANEALLEDARKFVKNLLEKNHAYSCDSELQKARAEIGDEFWQEIFHPFRKYLLSLLDSEGKSRFQSHKLVDYSRFRKLWNEKFGKDRELRRNCPVDLCWHVIRSYIKGWDAEALLDECEDYEELSQGDRSVSTEIFQMVLDRVWPWYKELLSEGYWDDQDLARYLLEKSLVKPRHPAVFADEAQDFTRLELDLIFHLNLYSDRILGHGDISLVPFAFAGDPFQTLNPTGFRWENVKSMFADRILADPANEFACGERKLYYFELQHNYRSSPGIVRFTNAIQCMRSALFNDTDLKPQKAWSTTGGAPVMLFDSNDAEFWRLCDDNQYEIIIPCNENEELDYVRSDPILQAHVVIENETPKNVSSAARAKGREFSDVVVYGFGTEAPVPLTKAIENAAERRDERDLPMAYFFNKLYVAVTRARNRLLIVDTEEGKQRLWQWFADESRLTQALDSLKLRNTQEWREHWDVWVPGDANELMRMGSAYDPKAKAEQLEEDGKSRRDPYILRQAAQHYRSAGDSISQKLCQALANRFDERYIEAGNEYAELNMVEDAVACYWLAGEDGWLKLKSNEAFASTAEGKWARLLLSPDLSLDGLVEAVEAFASLWKVPKKYYERYDQDITWQDAFARLLKYPLSAYQSSRRNAMRILESLLELEQAEFVVPDHLLARLHYVCGEFSKAVEAWERSEKTRDSLVRLPEYCEAKANTTPYPDTLDWLQRLVGTHNRKDVEARILDQFNRHRDVPLGSSHARIVCDLLLARDEQPEELLRLAWQHGFDSHLAEAAARWCVQPDGDGKALAAAKACIYIAAREGRWQAVLPLMDETPAYRPTAAWQKPGPQSWVKSRLLELQAALVRGIARSDVSGRPFEGKRPADWLDRTFPVNSYMEWKNVLAPLELGAAYERLGKHTATVAFYESALGRSSWKQIAPQLSKRLLLVKRRWNDWKNLENDKDEEERARLRSERAAIDREAEKLKIRLDELPEYPELDPIPIPVIPATRSTRSATMTSKPAESTAVTGRVASTALLTKAARTEPSPPYLLVERSGLSPEIYSPKGELLHVELGAVRFALQIPRRVCILEDINTLDRLRIRLDDLTVEADSDIVLDTKDEGWEVPSWKLSIRRDAQKPNRLHLELARPKLHAQLVWLSPLPSPSQR